MRFDELPETIVNDQVECEAGKPDPRGDSYVPMRIPLKIDEEMVLRSLPNTAHIAKARIIGAKVGEYILITEPAVRINEGDGAVLDEGFLCSCSSGGNLYVFQSRCLRYPANDVMCIEYPGKVEVRRIRKLSQDQGQH